MRKISIILIMGCLSVLAGAQMLQAQATAEGQVIDAETGRPLAGAHVYLSGTKIGTATDLSGQYRIRRIPAGGYRLVVSMIGYGRTTTQMIIGPGDIQKKDFELKPVVYELPEIYVGDFDKRWEKNLDRFADHFIGETEWADSVKILNPEVLRFDKKWWGRLTAEAMAPLQIENRALGYRITYHLKEFKHSGNRTRWDGEPLFTEMTPVDSAQAAYWERNRREAFYGSIRHFLLALLDNRLKQEGFVLYNHRQGVHGYSSQNKFRTSGRRFIREGEESFLYRFNFSGRLEIIYMREEENGKYVHWLQNAQRGPAGTQTSFLELNEHPITVDADGEIIQPYGATQFGYYAYSRLADLTPREYRPQGYPASNNQ